jgi:hypothetical protein
MTTTLRQVLEHFERSQGAVSLPNLARTLGIERETLRAMLDYWVRKGKLREAVDSTCGTCGSAAGCPYVIALPRSYELVTDAEPTTAGHTSGCACGRISRD